MTSNWKIAPKPVEGDPSHSDPFRSPTPKGHHPHAFPTENETTNPQTMYEYREGFAPVKPLANARPPSFRTPLPPPRYPVGAYAPPPVAPPVAPPQNFFSFVAEHPFLTFGFGALVFYGLSKLKEKDAQIRINPSYPLVANPSLVLSPGESSTISASDCDKFGRPLVQAIAAPSIKVSEVVKSEETLPNLIIKPVPSSKAKKEKIPRPGFKGRRTTQARDEDGKYLSSGTRKRAKTEGKR